MLLYRNKILRETQLHMSTFKLGSFNNLGLVYNVTRLFVLYFYLNSMDLSKLK